MKDDRSIIPAGVWARFESGTTIDIVNERITAQDGSFIDLKTNSVVLADGRQWHDVQLFPATRH